MNEKLKAKNIMTTNVKACTPQDTLDRAAEIMWNEDCGVVPVVESISTKQMRGVITDRDICMAAWSQNKLLTEILVDNIMVQSIVKCDIEEPLDEVEEKMQENQIHRIPVVDRENTLQGIISLADIVRNTFVSDNHSSELTPNVVANILNGVSARH